MDPNNACVQEVPLNAGVLRGALREPEMTITRHRQLWELAYSTKKFMDEQGGVKSHEVCRFGQMMSEILNLK
jgi:hypothetical protein